MEKRKGDQLHNPLTWLDCAAEKWGMNSGKKPNILIMVTDQQRGDTIHALGNEWIQTPNLDRLCAEGTAFTSAYTPSACLRAGALLLVYGAVYAS